VRRPGCSFHVLRAKGASKRQHAFRQHLHILAVGHYLSALPGQQLWSYYSRHWTGKKRIERRVVFKIDYCTLTV
jgi:hypothetical protein